MDKCLYVYELHDRELVYGVFDHYLITKAIKIWRVILDLQKSDDALSDVLQFKRIEIVKDKR